MLGLFPEASAGTDFSLRFARVASLREQVTDVLREAILDFRIRPGQRLIERELIQQTGVSRTTIREVLRQLAAEGLVTAVPHKGAVVVVPSLKEAHDVYEARAALEALAVRLFVQRASDSRVATLRDALTEIERVTQADGDIREMLHAKDRFYDILLDGSGNECIPAMLFGLRARVRLLRAASLRQPGRASAAVREIRAIVEAIEARDEDAAAQAATHHMNQAANIGLLTRNAEAAVAGNTASPFPALA